MDGFRFDQLARAWFASKPRRAILRALLGLPLGAAALQRGAAAQADDEAEDAAGDEQRSRKERCRQRKGKGQGHHGRRKHCQARHRGHHNHNHKKKKSCRPEPTATTCDGRCGPVANNCDQTVDCGPCVCDPACVAGQVCCDETCFTGICCATADCVPAGDACVDHQCQCGSGAACSGETPDCCGSPAFCTNIDTDAGNCGACGHTCTGETPVCWDGVCVCADVCPSGCQFTSVEDAVAAALPGSTVTICDGEYLTSVNVFKALTLRGRGADRTTLRGPGQLRVMEVRDVVLVQDLTITGGNFDLGGGILNRGTLTLQRVDVTDNTASTVGGGIANFVAGGSPHLILDHSHVTLNTATSGGGGILNSGGTVTLDADSTICDNSEPQCEGFTPPSGFCGACP